MNVAVSRVDGNCKRIIVSIRATGFLTFFDSAIFSPRNQDSKFALEPRPIKLTDSRLKKQAWVIEDAVTSCQEPRNSFDLNFCFGKGDIYLFTMPDRCVVLCCSETDINCCGRVPRNASFLK